MFVHSSKYFFFCEVLLCVYFSHSSSVPRAQDTEGPEMEMDAQCVSCVNA